ncbi:MAG TPA: MurR/RpiR family transcriptional regulator [Ignavibacteriaceae bacterium]|nr:MurR/RpiR family transcriptional regulator [Ignavibacteriaceae bacterium]
MTSNEEIKDTILKNYEDLPSNQKRIAECILENFNRVPFLSVRELSLISQSSVASVVRFSKRIGFDGYSEFKEKIAGSLQKQINNTEFFALFDGKAMSNDTLKSVAATDIKNINDTLSSVNRNTFNKAVTAILRANHVYTAGLGISYLLSEILSYQLTQVGVKSSNFRRNSLLFLEQALFLGKNDLIIVFSFPPYSKETINLAKFCKDRKVRVIAVTDKQSAPASFFAGYVLEVKSKNMLYTNSFAAISVLINAIVTEIAVRNKAEVKQFYEEVETITQE